MFKCPYCYKNTTVNNKIFDNWFSVDQHSRNCNSNTKEYFIDKNHGPIHISEFLKCASLRDFKYKFPNTKSNFHIIKEGFKHKGLIDKNDILCYNPYTKEKCIELLHGFYRENNRVPTTREFKNNTKYPHHSHINKLFGSWNHFIVEAGYEPNNSATYGNPTKALDGVIYKSTFEARFVNKFLYNKYLYEYEPKYDNTRYKYDFYLPQINLYIELAGLEHSLKYSKVLEKKIKINKEQGKNLLVIKPKDIEVYTSIKEFL